mmetsp:Transcript_53328/g.62265  ORF Transcript_53328/g.62265 Transcript_53328/m.62265 type:complete len:84 (+) Transcript_53328:47-298(+)
MSQHLKAWKKPSNPHARSHAFFLWKREPNLSKTTDGTTRSKGDKPFYKASRKQKADEAIGYLSDRNSATFKFCVEHFTSWFHI